MGAESTAVSASEGQWLVWSHVWPVEPMVPHQFNRRLCRKVHNDYKRLFLVGGLYICLSPAIWSLLQFKETPYTLKNTSKPSKHTFVSENTRLAQVWVREQGVVCYAWELARQQVYDPPIWCGAASTTLCRGCRLPSFVEKLLSGNRDQGDHGDLT